MDDNIFHILKSDSNFIQINTRLPQLSKYWPDIVKEKYLAFCKHEWEKRLNSLFDIFQYFEVALNIRKHKNYNLLGILNNVGLNTTTSDFHTYTEIVIKQYNSNGPTENNQPWEIVLLIIFFPIQLRILYGTINKIWLFNKPAKKYIFFNELDYVCLVVVNTVLFTSLLYKYCSGSLAK